MLQYLLTKKIAHIICRYKTEVVQRYVLSKLKWPFSIYNIPDTWVNENIEIEKTDVIENGCRFLLVVIFRNSATKENVWL